MITAQTQLMIDEMPADIAGDLNFPTEEYEQRYQLTRQALKDNGIDVLIVCGDTNMNSAYNAAFRYYAGPNIDESLGVNYVILPINGRAALVTNDGPQLYSFLSTYPRVPIEPLPAAPLKGTDNQADFAGTIAGYVGNAGLKTGSIGIADLSNCPTSVYLALQAAFPDKEIVDATELVNGLRRIKSAEEVRFLRRSAYIADIGMAALVEYVRPGVSIKQCIQVVNNAMSAAGARADVSHMIGGGTFPTQMEQAVRNSPYRYQLGDVVTNELTADYKGYITQLARPIVLGKDPNEAFVLFEKVNTEVYQTLYGKFTPGAKVRTDLDATGETLAQAISGGKWRCPFACQSVDLDQASTQTDHELQPGMAYVLMPWIGQANGWKNKSIYPPMNNWVGHAWGNTILCTEDGPQVLHATEMGVVIKKEFEDILQIPIIERDQQEGPEGNWRVSFYLPGGMQEKELRVNEEAAYVDGNIVPFSYDDGSVNFELTVGTTKGPMTLLFNGWMIGNEIAGAFKAKRGSLGGQRNRFSAER